MDYLYGTPFEIEQPKDMYHFSSDSELLGRFLKIGRNDTVLDIGTNNGVLLMYASMQQPKKLAGIDLFEAVIETAERNLKRNGIEAELSATPLQNYRHEPFTQLICNPPFFTNRNDSLKKENPYLRAARHDDTLPLKDLFQCSAGLMQKGGTFSVILPYDRFLSALSLAETEAFALSRMAAVYDREGGKWKRILLAFRYREDADLQVEPIRYLDRLHVDAY